MSQVSGDGDYEGFRLMKMEAADCDLATKIQGVALIVQCTQSGTLALSPPFCILILGTARQKELLVLDTELVFSFFCTILLHTLFNSTDI
jgi:hypothetical protein